MTIDQLLIEERYGFHVFTGENSARYTPKLAGDEYLHDYSDGWQVLEKVRNGESFFGGTLYRRKVDVGAGYELARLDDLDTLDLEVLYDGQSGWVRNEPPNKGTIRDHLSRSSCAIAFRRRKQPEAKAGWISVKDRLPEIKVPVIVCDTGGMRQVCLLLANDRKFVTHWGNDVFLNATHWQPLPAPPTPEINPDEEAFEEAYKDFTMPTYRMPDDPKVRARKFWDAARNGSWIKCTDHLPNDTCDVWAYAGGKPVKAHYQGGWYHSTGFAVANKIEGVTHWHEIKAPAAPEGQQ